jgi:hypothetical protein
MLVECESYYDLCDYEQENFDVECFGDCGRNDPFGPSKIDLSDIWSGCGGEATMGCER